MYLPVRTVGRDQVTQTEDTNLNDTQDTFLLFRL